MKGLNFFIVTIAISTFVVSFLQYKVIKENLEMVSGDFNDIKKKIDKIL